MYLSVCECACLSAHVCDMCIVCSSVCMCVYVFVCVCGVCIMCSSTRVCMHMSLGVCVCVCVGAGWAEAGCKPSDEVEHEEKAGIHPWRLALPRTGWT